MHNRALLETRTQLSGKTDKRFPILSLFCQKRISMKTIFYFRRRPHWSQSSSCPRQANVDDDDIDDIDDDDDIDDIRQMSKF